MEKTQRLSMKPTAMITVCKYSRTRLIRHRLIRQFA